MPTDDFDDVLSQVDELLASSRTSGPEAGLHQPAHADVDGQAELSVVRSFDIEMVETALRTLGIRYFKDPDGGLMVRYGYDPEVGCSTDVWLSAEGETGEILAIRTVSDKRFSRSEIGRLVLVCNQWNRENRWPNATVFFDGESPDAFIGLEFHIALSAGIHQALLNDIIQSQSYGGYFF